MQKRFHILFVLISISLIGHGQIIADHTVVDRYDNIPQQYIDEVKKMWISLAGESHSEAYRVGCELLEGVDSRFQVNVVESGTPEAYTTTRLRISRGTWGDVNNSSGWIYSYGEEDWFTNTTAVNRTKAGLLYCYNHGPALTAIGFGWCWDPTYPGVSGTIDPVYYTRWGGCTDGGPQGSRIWGLDAADQALTGNSVCMDTYLNATSEYISYCAANSIPTKIIFTTGPIDSGENHDNDDESGYQQYLKYQHIRNYVNSLSDAFFLDYADILSYSDAGAQATTSWTDYNGTPHTFPIIHSENLAGGYVAHIGNNGALKLGKAIWWLLARMAGWDGGTGFIPVSGITVTGAGGSSIITTDNGTLQLTAAITPTNATSQAVTWSVVNGTGQATISSSGLVTAVSNGTVTARATATDGSGVVGSLVVTISNQIIPVTGITVTGAGGSTQITTDNGTLQLTAAISPTNATNHGVTWSIVNGTGEATISISGLVTAVSSGTVTARATATDGSGVVGSLVITISGQVIPVTGITVTGAGGASTITTDNGTLQLTAAISPTNATNQAVTWSVVNGTGQATISSSGLVTAVSNGTVTARATANDGSGVVGSLVITISGQVIPVTGITVTGAGGASTITTDNGTLQLTAAISPTNATNQAVTWSVVNGTGQATISSSGLVTAVSNGTVTARATANDGSGVVGSLVITISSQVIPVTGITVTGAGGHQ